MHWTFGIVVIAVCIIVAAHTARVGKMDILLPYGMHSPHGPRHSNRHVRDCQHAKYGNLTHSLHPSQDTRNLMAPIIESHQLVVNVGLFSDEQVLGHYYLANYPSLTVSVLEPLSEGTCQAGREDKATVMQTASRRDCLLAVNAGFFDMDSGECLGNVVSDGRIAHDSIGIQNPHFGIMENGSLFTGFLSEKELWTSKFSQLVGGVIWLVRDGDVYVDESKTLECSDTQSSGSLDEFVSLRSARLAVGHDVEGRLIILEFDGKTFERGINLWDMATYLVELGAVNAINLDGGGSVTAVVNGTLVNYPSDDCIDLPVYNCAREVSTVLCVHPPECTPHDCSGHGSCVMGSCQCGGFWSGAGCDTLKCDCLHGTCTADGCVCDPGWLGTNCTDPCPAGRYGLGCAHTCKCEHSRSCDLTDGSCVCQRGYTGLLCDRKCPYGFYGSHCASLCYCPGGCTCDHITGICNVTLEGTELLQASHCLANTWIQERHLVVDQPDQYRLWLVSIIILSIICTCSITINISCLCVYCGCLGQSNKSQKRYKRSRRKFNRVSANISDSSLDESEAEHMSMVDLLSMKGQL